MKSSQLEQNFAMSSHSPTVKTVRSLLSPQIEIKDFCVPINVCFPNEAFKMALHSDLDERLKYYPSEPQVIANKVAKYLGLDPLGLIVGNGSTEIFYHLLGTKKRRLLTPVPTFGRWTDAPKDNGHYVHHFERREHENYALNVDRLIEEAHTNNIDTVIISNPNNPTGALSSKSDLLKMINRLSDIDLIIIDESFLDFSPRKEEVSLLHDVERFSNVVVLKSLGKSLGLHGTRLGVMTGNRRIVSRYKNAIPFWNINGVAESVIDLLPRYKREFKRGLIATMRMTEQMKTQLKRVDGLKVFDTQANFVFVKAPEYIDPIGLRDHLLCKYGLFIRSCGNKVGSTSGHYRIAARPHEDIEKLVDAMNEYIKTT